MLWTGRKVEVQARMDLIINMWGDHKAMGQSKLSSEVGNRDPTKCPCKQRWKKIKMPYNYFLPSLPMQWTTLSTDILMILNVPPMKVDYLSTINLDLSFFYQNT